jgi:hypothetical protein
MSTYPSGQVGLDWHVSRTCESGACVGVARQGEFVLICNTSSPEGPVSKFTPDKWRQFIAGVRLGDFDDIA